MLAAADKRLLVASEVADFLAELDERAFAAYCEAKSFAEAMLARLHDEAPLIVAWRSITLRIDRDPASGRYYVSAVRVEGFDPSHPTGGTLRARPSEFARENLALTSDIWLAPQPLKCGVRKSAAAPLAQRRDARPNQHAAFAGFHPHWRDVPAGIAGVNHAGLCVGKNHLAPP